MFYMDILPLSDLIKAEMERRNISIREFADLVGSTHPTIASILDGRVCHALIVIVLSCIGQSGFGQYAHVSVSP